MADTRPDIKLTGGVYIDLYAALNAQAGYPAVTVGTQIRLQNKSGSVIDLIAKADQPDSDDGSVIIEPFKQATNQAGDSGAWAYSNNTATINITVV